MRIPLFSLAVGGSLALALTLTACGDSSDGAKADDGAGSSTSSSSGLDVDQAARDLLPAEIREAGVLRIASDPTYPPFELLDTDNKTMIGWDVDYSDALADVLGLRAEHIPATFDTILPGLSSGKYDMAISAFNMTPERAEIVDFVQYQYGGSGVAVQPGNPLDIHMDALSMCGHSIAGQKGSVQTTEMIPGFSEECAAAGEEPIDLLNFPSQNEANLALVSGRADGVVADTVSLTYQGKLADNKFVLVPGDEYLPDRTGLALGKDSGLAEAVTAAAKIVIASDYYREISEEWGIPESSLISPSDLDGN